MNEMNSVHLSVRRHMIAGILLITLVSVGVGGWTSATQISGAVIAGGQLVVESNVKKIQHPAGGVVDELRVHNGSHVEAGEILLRLDDTLTRTNVSIITRQIDEYLARRARNEAEQDESSAVIFPPELLGRRDEPRIGQLIKGEDKLFHLRMEARDGKKAQLRERIEQLAKEHYGLASQEMAKAKEIDWVQQELVGVRDLWAKQMVQFPRVTALEREATRLYGERGHLLAAMAQTKGKITETELQIIQIDQDMRTEVGRELAEIRGKMSELLERRGAAEDQLKRMDLRAPQSGVVHQLNVHTIGGVITQSEPVMLIVPNLDQLSVEVKIQPNDIDQLRLGQGTQLRFPTFNQRTTPELEGIVTHIGADVTQDARTSTNYYLVRIGIPQEQLPRLEGLKLLPGMPVECFVQTNPRTVISYLIRPIEDQVIRAFREK